MFKFENSVKEEKIGSEMAKQQQKKTALHPNLEYGQIYGHTWLIAVYQIRNVFELNALSNRASNYL